MLDVERVSLYFSIADLNVSTVIWEFVGNAVFGSINLPKTKLQDGDAKLAIVKGKKSDQFLAYYTLHRFGNNLDSINNFLEALSPVSRDQNLFFKLLHCSNFIAVVIGGRPGCSSHPILEKSYF